MGTSKKDIIEWYKANEAAIHSIPTPIPYTKGQIIQDLPLFIQTQMAGLESPEKSVYYRNALERLGRLREYLITHHNIPQ